MQETWVRPLGWEDLLGESMATHASILPWRIRTDRGAWRAAAHGIAELDTTESLSTHTPLYIVLLSHINVLFNEKVRRKSPDYLINL